MTHDEFGPKCGMFQFGIGDIAKEILKLGRIDFVPKIQHFELLVQQRKSQHLLAVSQQFLYRLDDCVFRNKLLLHHDAGVSGSGSKNIISVIRKYGYAEDRDAMPHRFDDAIQSSVRNKAFAFRMA